MFSYISCHNAVEFVSTFRGENPSGRYTLKKKKKMGGRGGDYAPQGEKIMKSSFAFYRTHNTILLRRDLIVKVVFSSVQSLDRQRSSGGHEGRFNRDPPPVFSAGGPFEQIWHGQGRP